MVELLAVYAGLGVLAPLFALAERRAPASRRQRSRRARTLDAAYWLLTPLLTGTLARWLLLGTVAVIALGLGWTDDGARALTELERRSPLGELPLWLLVPLTVLVADLLGYLSHRLRHGAWLWRVHAVHHAPRELTALAAARMHPLDEALDATWIGAPLLLAGVPFWLVAALGPCFLLHTLLLHANVRWSFGPLAKVLASPRFHRRHHARDLAPANFGGLLSVWDVAFGTFDLPDPPGVELGVPDDVVPESLVGQLLYPLRGARGALR